MNSQPTARTITYVAIDKNTSSVFNFGEETFILKGSQWVLQTSWMANMSTSSHAGLLLPGLFLSNTLSVYLSIPLSLYPSISLSLFISLFFNLVIDVDLSVSHFPVSF